MWGVGRAELLPFSMGAEAGPGPGPDSEHTGCSPRCQGSSGEVELPRSVTVCVCEHVRMETWNPGTSVSRLGVTRQEMCSPAWDVTGA